MTTTHQHAATVLLQDTFERINELVDGITDGLSREQSAFRPDPGANSIGWLVWHLSRVQDHQIAGLTGSPQVWTEQGWDKKFDLPLDPGDTGYGHTAEQVGQVSATGELLAGYHRAVRVATSAYLEGLAADGLDRIVDRDWDPPVTAGVRLVSTFADCLQHCGQAGYVRGLADRSTG
ncbi:DUF664 domain-containing protein [Nakamurella silvestris]|nr:DUF664 domain-containing protein [Nakamurella silvestris]